MLTVEQVKEHSQLFLASEQCNDEYARCKARLLYLFNGQLSKLSIICPLPTMLIETDIEHVTEEGVSMFIEWQMFTDWINRLDDLGESDLLTPDQYSDYLTKHRKERGILGWQATLDTIEGKVIDHSKFVLV